MDLSDLYSEKLLELAAHLPEAARLADADGTARKISRVCGSVVEVDVKLRRGVVTEYGAEISACALGQTSAAVMARHVIGSTPDELRSLRLQMHAMLKDNGAPPTGKWADLRYLEAVREYRPRHMSTLLVFDAVVDAIEAAEHAAVA